MSHGLRVCHVIPTLQHGGAEDLLVELAEVAGSAGLELSVVSLRRTPASSVLGCLQSLDVPVRTLDFGPFWDLRTVSGAVRAIRDLRPDVIHTHMKHADLVGAVARRRLGIPMVSTLHVIEEGAGALGGAKRWLASLARLRGAARTIAVSEAQRRWYLGVVAADPKSVVTIHNGVRRPVLGSEERCQVRSALGVSDACVVVAMIGIMRPGKGHAELLAAASRVRTSPDSEIVVVIAGDGPLRGQLEASGREGGAPVRFVGFWDDVPRLVAAADVVVQPSLLDALPTSLIHGLAAGVPAIASDVGGIPEIIAPDAGILVPPGDVEALASAISDLAADPGARQRMGEAALRRFDAEFDAERWVSRLRSVYDDVRGGTGVL